MSYRKKRLSPKQGNRNMPPVNIKEYGNITEYRMLPISSITSGLPYQRPVQPRDVAPIRGEWDDRMFHALVVSFRDGKFNLIDGQHRLTAILELNPERDVLVLCRVLTNLTYEQEAGLCAAFDAKRKAMSKAEAVTAWLEAGCNPDISEIRNLMLMRGFKWSVDRKTAKIYHINCTSTVIRAYQLLGSSLFARMLDLLDHTWHGDPDSLCAYMISGVALFLKTYETEIKDKQFAKQLSSSEPAEILRRSRADLSTSSTSLRCARVLLKKYNGHVGGRKLPYRFES